MIFCNLYVINLPENVRTKTTKKQPVNEEFYNENDERDFPEPSMEELLLKVKGAGKKLNEQKPIQQPKALTLASLNFL